MTTVTKEIIATDLRALGLKVGDTVILHSSLASLGKVAGGAETVVKAFFDVLGKSGTLVVPTFGALGILTDTVKKWPGAVQSIHPLASVAAVGAHAAEICEDHWKADLAHGENTPYTRIADLGGYICLLGVDQDRNTTLHTVEELLRLPYLKTSEEKTFHTPDGEVTKKWPFFPGPHRNFIGLDSALRISGKMKTGKVGSAVTRLIKSRDLIDICLEIGSKNNGFVLCDNPNCNDCVAQRADLFRARLKKESFKFAVSAMLAGRYAPEILENCRNAGVDALELDGIHGKPIEMVNAEILRKITGELIAGGLSVAALRYRSSVEDIGQILENAKSCGIRRIVFPLTHDAPAQAEKAVAQGVQISFFNTVFNSGATSDILLKIKERGLNLNFTFNASSFARIGEKPFFKSYKQKLRRFVDQLDVEDCLYDGTSQALANGNAEIKEMISILRCAGFDGFMVLTTGNQQVSSLLDTVKRFMELLAAM